VEESRIAQAQQGDELAFESIIADLGDQLYSTAFHILRDTAAADDATQQAIVDMWRNLPRLRDPSRFKPWAFRILVRAAWAEERGRRRAMLRLVVGAASETRQIPDATRTVDQRDQLDRAFRHLSPGQRTVVVLKHYVGLSDHEIADLLALPEGTVRSRLHRSLQSLRAEIEADERGVNEAIS
jgi:RNA polymerase sigma-70 factor (ECF subfamily)